MYIYFIWTKIIHLPSINLKNQTMKLLESVKIGNQVLKNSMAMAPMTRS